EFMGKDRFPLRIREAEARRWQEIGASTIAVLLLSQRISGLWAYPTIRKEIDQYYEGSNSSAFGEAEYGSYTVTLPSLLALQELLTTVPPACLRRADYGFRRDPTVDGGRGRRVTGARTRTVAIAPSPRHTAFALLSLMHFFPTVSIDELFPSIRFLLR